MGKKGKKRHSSEETWEEICPELNDPKNIDFPVDNIIVGLLKNMLRKNKFSKNNYYGEKEDTKYFFQVILDTKGFDSKLIMEALSELTLNSQMFYKDDILFSNQIRSLFYYTELEVITFDIEKEKLITLRNSILENKYLVS